MESKKGDNELQPHPDRHYRQSGIREAHVHSGEEPSGAQGRGRTHEAAVGCETVTIAKRKPPRQWMWRCVGQSGEEYKLSQQLFPVVVGS